MDVLLFTGTAAGVVAAAAGTIAVFQARAKRPGLRSENSETETEVTFINRTGIDLTLWWINFDGQPVSFGRLEAWGVRKVKTYVTHPWRVGLSDEPASQLWYPKEKPSRIIIHGPGNPERIDIEATQEDVG